MDAELRRVEVAALIVKNNAKGRFITKSSVAAGIWSLAVIKQAGRAQRQESEELTCIDLIQICVPTARRMLTGKSANQQRRVPISYWRAGLEVLCERGVSWIESRHDSEACQEVTTVGDRGPARLSFFYQR